MSSEGGAVDARARFVRAILVSATLAGCGSAERGPSSRHEAPRDESESVAAGDAQCDHLGDAEPRELTGITAAHNAIRCRVARPQGGALVPLSWSASLATDAQRYADQLAKNGCRLQHAQTDHGENLFGGSGKNGAAAVVERWAAEERCFRYASFPETCSCTCGHYSQIVWADTQRLGCGMAPCADGGEVWVCRYDPAGNYVGRHPY
jgi:pathogenesis-related protein 1